MSTEQQPIPAPAPTAHHPLGPSQWPMIFECACFESIVDDPEDIDADEEDMSSAKGRGRVKHRAVAILLTGTMDERRAAFDGLSDREAAEVRYVVEQARAIYEGAGYQESDGRVEQRVTLLKPDVFEPLYFGTEDYEVGPFDMDWKFGEERNYFPQLCGYALPKMEARGESRRFGIIIYGRLRKVVRYVLERRTVETVAYGLLARRTSEHRRPTPCQYCGWCAARLTCSAFVSEPVTLVARREDWTLKLPTPHVSQLHDPAWLGAARFIWKRYLEPWGEAVEFASSSMASAGRYVPAGFKKRPEKGRTTISNMRKAFEALKETVGEDVLWQGMGAAVGSLAKLYAESAGISEDKAKGIITAKLADARALSVGEPTFKLIAEKGAEDLIRAALSASSSPVAKLPE